MSVENQHTDFESFKKYYTGKMSPEERDNFEKELEKDPFAKEAYEGFLVFETDFQRISAIENTNILFKEKYNLNDETGVFPIKTLMGIAASIVLLFGGFFLVQNSFFNSNTNLAENNVEVHSEQDLEEKSEIIEVLADDSNNNILIDSSDNIPIDAEEPEAELEIENIESEVKEKDLFANTKDESQKANSDKLKKTNSNKQIGSAQYEEYYKNQNNSGNYVTTNSSSDNIESVSPNPATFNSIAIEEDMLEENENNNSISNYKTGIGEYNKSNYNQAIQYFHKSVAEKKNINSSNYYIGMSYFNQSKANKAINYFDKVIYTSSSFSDDAQWYKAITLINKGQKEKAKTLLIEIINSNSGFSSAAQKKLNALNR